MTRFYHQVASTCYGLIFEDIAYEVPSNPVGVHGVRKWCHRLKQQQQHTGKRLVLNAISGVIKPGEMCV